MRRPGAHEARRRFWSACISSTFPAKPSLWLTAGKLHGQQLRSWSGKKGGAMLTFGTRSWTTVQGRLWMRMDSQRITSRIDGLSWSAGWGSAWAEGCLSIPTAASGTACWKNSVGERPCQKGAAWTMATRGWCRSQLPCAACRPTRLLWATEPLHLCTIPKLRGLFCINAYRLADAGCACVSDKIDLAAAACSVEFMSCLHPTPIGSAWFRRPWSGHLPWGGAPGRSHFVSCTVLCERRVSGMPVKGSVHLGVKGFTLEWEVPVGFTLEWEGSIKPRVHLGVKRFTLEWEVSLGFTLEWGKLNQTKGPPWSERVQFRVGSVFRVHLRVRRAQPNQGFTLEWRGSL